MIPPELFLQYLEKLGWFLTPRGKNSDFWFLIHESYPMRELMVPKTTKFDDYQDSLRIVVDKVKEMQGVDLSLCLTDKDWNYVAMLRDAEAVLEAFPLYETYIVGSPLEHRLPPLMVDFAIQAMFYALKKAATTCRELAYDELGNIGSQCHECADEIEKLVPKN